MTPLPLVSQIYSAAGRHRGRGIRKPAEVLWPFLFPFRAKGANNLPSGPFIYYVCEEGETHNLEQNCYIQFGQKGGVRKSKILSDVIYGRHSV